MNRRIIRLAHTITILALTAVALIVLAVMETSCAAKAGFVVAVNALKP